MIRFIKRKLQNKKWLNFGLLIGVILLSSFLSVYPMFREGSLNKLIVMLFDESIAANETFPATFKRNGQVLCSDFTSVDMIIDKMNEYETTWTQYLDIPVVERQQVIYSSACVSQLELEASSKALAATYVPELESKTKLVYGVRANDASSSQDENVKKALAAGALPCNISQKGMDLYNLSVGEMIIPKSRTWDSESSGLKYVVVGIIEEADEPSIFWFNSLASYDFYMFLTKEDMDKVILSNPNANMFYDEIVMFDYTAINSKNAKNIEKYVKDFMELDKNLSVNFLDLLVSFSSSEKSISLILATFELPIIMLLLLFLYMISDLILKMETTEIAMLKSRGVKRIKIIWLYVLQSSVIAGAGSIIGLPIGYLLCKIGAGTNAFLSFSFKNVTIYKPTPGMLLFALAAFALAVLFMTIPVFKLSKLNIIDRKGSRIDSKGKSFWEKYFIDLILLAISSYLLFNYYKQRTAMALDIISGGSVDPVIFLDSTLFIFAFGLVFLRLIHYAVKLIYKLGRRGWSPSAYVAFLQIIRTAKKQGFISVFLVTTIAMGVFNSSLARTVNENMKQRTIYNVGADMVVTEKWKMTVMGGGDTLIWYYDEPDFGRYKLLSDCGVVQSTPVLFDENVDITAGGKTEMKSTLMGIDTKAFGEIAHMKDGVTNVHWYNYLNELAKEPTGVLISKNYADKYDVKVGDYISYSRYSPISSKEKTGTVKGKVVGIVEAFPGYQSVVYETDDAGKIKERDNFLVVANYANVKNNFPVTPVTSMWMKLDDKADEQVLRDKMNEMGMNIKSITSLEEKITLQQNTAMLQITNGMFSIGFVISLLICGVGFLIYWILTIKERELIYGIYRAMGMSMKEIVKMLILEQIFGSFLAAVAGFGTGYIATALFAKLITIVYLPYKHNIPIGLCLTFSDNIKMIFIIGFAFVACFVVISRIVRGMNITQALKLGSD